MLAHPWLAAQAAVAQKGTHHLWTTSIHRENEASPQDEPGIAMVELTVNEIRRLWAALNRPHPPEKAILAWSNRRRHRQGRGRHCHYQRRLKRGH
jgi:hypothetical protein